MATAWSRRPSDDMTEEDELQRKITMKQEQHLIPLKEDLAEWLNKTLEGDDITTENFMDKLDNGVIVCKLARLIQQKAEESSRRGSVHEAVPSIKFKCWENAKSQSFYARDNAENFIKWCRKFGVHEAVIFESDGLVLHTQPRTVVLCLLELGRIAAKYEIEPPGLVQLEKEIDEHEEDDHASDLSSTSSASSPVSHRRGDSELTSPIGLTATSPDSSSSGSRNPTPVPTKRHKLSELDKKVMHIANNVCKDQSQITRISEGRYCIAGRTCFVRLLKGRHVMVRVGGGWDTLEHFLSRHEPCQLARRRFSKLSLKQSAPAPEDHKAFSSCRHLERCAAPRCTRNQPRPATAIPRSRSTPGLSRSLSSSTITRGLPAKRLSWEAVFILAGETKSTPPSKSIHRLCSKY